MKHRYWLLALVFAACGSRGKDVDTASWSPAKTLSSLPRAKWPCGFVTIKSGGESSKPSATLHRYTYSKLERCTFPANYWQPGCPLADVQRKWEYDDRGRLSKYSELDIPILQKLVYKGDSVVSGHKLLSLLEGKDSAGEVLYKQRGDEVRMVRKARTLSLIKLSNGLPVSVQSYDPNDGSKDMDQAYTIRNGRPIEVKLTLHLLGVAKHLATMRWKYDGCAKK